MGRIPGYTAHHSNLMGEYVWEHDATGDYFIVRHFVPESERPRGPQAQYGFVYVAAENVPSTRTVTNDGRTIELLNEYNYEATNLMWPVADAKPAARSLAVRVLHDNLDSAPSDPTDLPWCHTVPLSIGGYLKWTEPPEADS